MDFLSLLGLSKADVDAARDWIVGLDARLAHIESHVCQSNVCPRRRP